MVLLSSPTAAGLRVLLYTKAFPVLRLQEKQTSLITTILKQLMSQKARAVCFVEKAQTASGLNVLFVPAKTSQWLAILSRLRAVTPELVATNTLLGTSRNLRRGGTAHDM